MSRDLRRPLRALNAARVVAVSTLLLASFLIEILFAPERPLTPLYWLAGAVYGTVLLYVFLERWLGDSALLGAIQIGADVAIVAAFVIASGGSVSPISFLFVVPVMIGAAVFGLRGGVSTATFAWTMYALVLIWEGLRDPAAVPPGRALYAALSHLVGFVALGALGGVLADRLRLASVELGKRESDLAALRALHQQIVESINTGILTTDREGRISFVNRAGRAILGESSESVVERTLQDVLGLPLELLRDAERAGDRRRNRFERTWHRPSDGEDLFLGFALSTLRGGDDVTLGWLLVFQDLTEIASLEQQVKTRERMAALGEMAAGMAHELRNPLAAISGCVQVLQEGRAGDQSAELVDVTRRETDRLNRIIRDFLDFARPGPFRPRPCDVAALMRELVGLLHKSPEVGKAHRISVIAAEPVWAMADPDRLRQVFWNLASNALKAMPDGGMLTVDVAGFGGDRVLLSFRDTGQGMDDETLERYFQPFSSGFSHGSGLGAAIVYRIAEEHGGDVQVVSRRGRGTEIRVILPRAEALAAKPAVTTAAE